VPTTPYEEITMTERIARRTALAMLATVPVILAATPCIQHETLYAYVGSSGDEFAAAWVRAVLGMAKARDAAATEHGEAARLVWEEAIDGYIRATGEVLGVARAERDETA